MKKDGKPKRRHGQRGPDISSRIRKCFEAACDRLEAKGKPLSHLIEQELENRPLETLKAMAAYCPKDSGKPNQGGLTVNIVGYADRLKLEHDVPSFIEGETEQPQIEVKTELQ